MKAFLKRLWIELNKPDWTMWQALMLITVFEAEDAFGYLDAGVARLVTADAVLFVIVLCAVITPLWLLGARVTRKVWHVDKIEYIRRRQESNDRHREHCVEQATNTYKQIGHTLGVAAERVEWRKMKAARDELVVIAKQSTYAVGEGEERRARLARINELQAVS